MSFLAPGNIYGERNDADKVGDLFFKVKSFSKEKHFENIDFYINRGEIVGFSGLVGAGRTELGRALFGAEPADSGTMYLEGGEIKNKNVEQAIGAGIGYISENRKEDGLYLEFDLKENLVANHLSDFTSGFSSTRRRLRTIRRSSV